MYTLPEKIELWVLEHSHSGRLVSGMALEIFERPGGPRKRRRAEMYEKTF